MKLVLAICLFITQSFGLNAMEGARPINIEDYWHSGSNCYRNVPVIDPRTFSGEREFGFVTPDNTPEKLYFITIRNKGGALTFFQREISNDKLTYYFPPSTRRIKASSRSSRSSHYGFVFCDAIFLGKDRLGFRSKGEITSPLFGLIVEPLEPGECKRSIFATTGGALISGELDFTKPFGPDYVSSEFSIIASAFFLYINGTAPYVSKWEEVLLNAYLRAFAESFRGLRDCKFSQPPLHLDLHRPLKHRQRY